MPKFIPRQSSERRGFFQFFKENLPLIAQQVQADQQEVQDIDRQIVRTIQNIDNVNQKELDLAAAIQQRNDEWTVFEENFVGFIGRLKANRSFSKSMSEQLGMDVEQQQSSSKNSSKNKELQVVIVSSPEKIKFSFKKLSTQNVAIYCRRNGAEEFILLDKISGNIYEDRRANLNGVEAEKREYCFALVTKDQEGQRSPIYSVAVLQD